ncbi:copper homeostasis protein cutC homolog [Adelges cooleyi]|uniref:copper homeostasis protein cutC homolog n=1 Tax=Adelges cooleyi TaxID=133065 RepID=UPI0021802795|nr:copper homeostasis protein cutC homolog [Adelges cooleyi]XP_050438679.1 copper homeostasis protein cutC homolog [Adelges cooleyi]
MEICVDNVESVLNAVSGGAHRLELCSALSEGGLTPSVGFFKIVKSLVSVPIFVMLRPRGGNDFQLSEIELKIILEDLQLLKNAGADGFVFGALTAKGLIDTAACASVISAAHPLPVTFHRAFDVATGDPMVMVNEIADLGFKRLLTSGRSSNAFDGALLIKHLIEEMDNKLIIIPGAGISIDNLKQILDLTLCREIHGSAKSLKNKTNNPTINLGQNLAPRIYVTDSNIVREFLKIFEDYLKQTF